MYEFKLPDVGEGIHEAEIVRWLVKVGNTIAQDEAMVEIQTDKALVEIPSPVAGTIVELKAKPGQMVHVGDLLIVINPNQTEQLPIVQPPQPANGQVESSHQIGIAGPGKRVLAAPAIRKMALEHGIELSHLSGSGQAGRILLSDLKQAIAQKQTLLSTSSKIEHSPKPAIIEEISSGDPKPIAPSPLKQQQTDIVPLQGLRRRIAERMTEAWQIPQVTSFDEVDVTELVALRQELKPLAAEQDVKLTYLPFIIKATIHTLQQFPDFNATLDMANQQIRYHRHYNIGIATAIDEGLIVPVLHQAEQLSLLNLARELTRLMTLAQTRGLALNELIGSTFTITNFGSLGGLQGTPIINPPEVAILGCGRIEERVVPMDGQPTIRPIMNLSLSFDHRLIDGALATRFLNYLKTLLNQPKRLFLEI